MDDPPRQRGRAQRHLERALGAIAAVDPHARGLAREVEALVVLARDRGGALRELALLGAHCGELEPHAVEDHLGRGVVPLALRLLLAVPVGDVAEHDAGLVRMRLGTLREQQRGDPEQ
jgi:hypothetical protein